MRKKKKEREATNKQSQNYFLEMTFVAPYVAEALMPLLISS